MLWRRGGPRAISSRVFATGSTDTIEVAQDRSEPGSAHDSRTGFEIGERHGPSGSSEVVLARFQAHRAEYGSRGCGVDAESFEEVGVYIGSMQRPGRIPVAAAVTKRAERRWIATMALTRKKIKASNCTKCALCEGEGRKGGGK